MYVDKTLSGIKAVNALAPQPRAPEKARRLRAGLPQRRGDNPQRVRRLLPDDDPCGDRPNKLHDLVADLDGAQVSHPSRSTPSFSDTSPALNETNSTRSWMPASPRISVTSMKTDKSSSRARQRDSFAAGSGFLSSVLPYGSADWEKRSRSS